MGFLRNGAVTHSSGLKSFDDLGGGLNLVKRDGLFGIKIKFQKPSQRVGNGLVIDHSRIFFKFL